MVHPIDRLLGWWSIDEGSREEQARLYCGESSGSVLSFVQYSTFTLNIVLNGLWSASFVQLNQFFMQSSYVVLLYILDSTLSLKVLLYSSH